MCTAIVAMMYQGRGYYVEHLPHLHICSVTYQCISAAQLSLPPSSRHLLAG